VRVPADDVGARRRPVHRDAVRGGTGIGGVPVRRRRDDGPRDRARKPGEPRPLSGPVAGAGSRPPPRRGQVMTIRSVRTRAGRARRCAAAALGGVLAAGALAACSSDPTRKSSGDTGVLNMYLYQKPKTFSPLAPNNGPDQLVMSFVFDSLYGVDGSYELKPHLAAAAPEVSDDAKTITFKLKPGLKWSDGEPLTSKDVVFTFNALADPDTGSAKVGDFAAVTGAKELENGDADTLKGVTAPDETTVKITTTRPAAGLPGLIGATPILPEHVLGDVPEDELGDHGFFNKPTV